jgi:tetratricopeptide (TPR) repeat protein
LYGDILIFILSAVIFKAMPYNSSEAKREMLAECRACCYNDPYKLAMIDEFGRTYQSADAILWYTKPCFLYRLINKALRTEDNLVVYKFRYFIMDLCTRLEEKALTSAYHKQPFRVYRGSKISLDEVEKLQVGSLVATNGFFSSSRHLDVAQRFIGIDPVTGVSPSRSRDDQRQYILFELDVDLINSPDVVVTDVSAYSSIPDENEILFNLGTTFFITSINYDDEHHVWYIRIITSSELAIINQEYNRYTSERCTETTPAISFGHLRCEILSDYSGALNYLHRLLRSKTWNDDYRPDTYHYLARVYYFMGKYEQAITFCKCVQLLLRRRLPEFSLTYARSLTCLSMIYSDIEDLPRAGYFQERAATIYRSTLSKNHYEFGFHLNYTAYLYWQNNQYASALYLLTNVLPIIKKTLPPNYPCNAQTLHITGLVQHSLNNREESIRYFKQSLQMRESFHAIDHPYLARTYYELSVLYLEINDYSTALDYAQKSLRIRKAKLPHNHKEFKQSVELVERLSQRDTAILSTQ